jgi:hypothetical protein
LDEWCRSVERPVSSDLGKTVVNLDELKVAGRDEWGGEHKAEFVQATLDPAHREQANWLQPPPDPGGLDCRGAQVSPPVHC